MLDDQKFKLLKKEEKILDPSSRLYHQINYLHHFKKRTFLQNTKEYANVSVEEVKLKLQEACQWCGSQLIAPQLKKAVENAS